MKIPKTTIEYLELMAEMFQARHDGKDDTEILDRMDVAWARMSGEEKNCLNDVSRVLGRVAL